MPLHPMALSVGYFPLGLSIGNYWKGALLAGSALSLFCGDSAAGSTQLVIPPPMFVEAQRVAVNWPEHTTSAPLRLRVPTAEPSRGKEANDWSPTCAPLLPLLLM